MSRLPVLTYPDPRLRQRALPVTVFGEDLRCLVADLSETLCAEGAIGLAAPQVAVPLRVVVVQAGVGGEAPVAYVNPRILARRGLAIVEEGCLSVPGVHGNVRRSVALRLAAMDLDGRSYERELEGLQAVCLQHELDHLDGTLFVDRLPWLRRIAARRRLGRLAAA